MATTFAPIRPARHRRPSVGGAVSPGTIVVHRSPRAATVARRVERRPRGDAWVGRVVPRHSTSTTYSLDPAAGNAGYTSGTAGTLVAATASLPFIAIEGAASWSAGGGSTAWQGGAMNTAIRFHGTGISAISLTCYLTNGGTVRVAIDGVMEANAITLSGTGYGSSGPLSVASYPSDGQDHEYRIFGSALVPQQLTVAGTVRTTPIGAETLIAYLGDSRIAGNGLTDTTNSFMLQASAPLGMQPFCSGVGSSTAVYWSGTGSTASCTTDSGEYRTDNVVLGSSIWPAAKVILIMHGINDLSTPVAGGYVSATFQAGAANLLRKLLLGNPDCIIVVEKVWPSNTLNIATLNADWQAAIAAVNSPRVFWRTGQYDTGIAVVHPTDAQSAVLYAPTVSDVQSALATGGLPAAPIRSNTYTFIG